MGRKLFLSEHVKARMAERNVTVEHMLDTIKNGKMENARNGAVMHWSVKDHVAIIIDWKKMYVVTVLHLTPGKHAYLMSQLIEKRKREAEYGR